MISIGKRYQAFIVMELLAGEALLGKTITYWGELTLLSKIIIACLCLLALPLLPGQLSF